RGGSARAGPARQRAARGDPGAAHLDRSSYPPVPGYPDGGDSWSVAFKRTAACRPGHALTRLASPEELPNPGPESAARALEGHHPPVQPGMGEALRGDRPERGGPGRRHRGPRENGEVRNHRVGTSGVAGRVRGVASPPAVVGRRVLLGSVEPLTANPVMGNHGEVLSRLRQVFITPPPQRVERGPGPNRGGPGPRGG